MTIQQLAKHELCRVAALTADGQGVVLEQEVPPLLAGHVLVRVTRSMVSAGTQLGQARALRQGSRHGEAVAMGYQCAGQVVAVGEGVSCLTVGDRVACLGGSARHATFNVVPQNLCAVVPDSVSDDEACGMNLVLTAMQANRRAEPVFGEYFLVVGMGVVGQLSAQIAQLAGCYVMGWDMMAMRLAAARQWGITATHQVAAGDPAEICRVFTDGRGFDAAIMAFGGDGSQALAEVTRVMKVTRDTHRMGRIVLVGGLSTRVNWGAAMSNLDLRSSARTGPGYHDKEWEVGAYDYPSVFVPWTTRTNMRLALRWMAEGRLKIEPLITHHFALDQFDQAVNLLVETSEQALGVVVDIEDR